jgi:hypothetical protein
MFKKIEDTFSIVITKNTKDLIRNNFKISSRNLLILFAKQYNELEYEQFRQQITDKIELVAKIKKEIITRLLEKYDLAFVVKLFEPIIDSWFNNEKTMSTN